MTSPDPVPPPAGPLAEIVTTEGTTSPATEMTGQALTVDDDAEVPELTVEPDDCVAPTMRPPATPPTTSAVPSATHSSHRRGLRARDGSLTPGSLIRATEHPSGHSERTRARLLSHRPGLVPIIDRCGGGSLVVFLEPMRSDGLF